MNLSGRYGESDNVSPRDIAVHAGKGMHDHSVSLHVIISVCLKKNEEEEQVFFPSARSLLLQLVDELIARLNEESPDNTDSSHERYTSCSSYSQLIASTRSMHHPRKDSPAMFVVLLM